MPEILEMIKDKDRLSFSQNYSVKRPYKGNTLFPDVKTPNLEAEYYRLSQGSALPTLAMVHALDTEAAIGTRPPMEKVTVEKFLIKEKINQSEKTQEYVKNGVDESGLVRKLSALTDRIAGRAEELAKAVLALHTGEDILAEAQGIRDTLLTKMSELRLACDEAEALTAKNYWPFPTYGDLLFSVK